MDGLNASMNQSCRMVFELWLIPSRPKAEYETLCGKKDRIPVPTPTSRKKREKSGKLKCYIQRLLNVARNTRHRISRLIILVIFSGLAIAYSHICGCTFHRENPIKCVCQLSREYGDVELFVTDAHRISDISGF